MKYRVIRGRHRLRGAEYAGVGELRCNVHRADGSVRLQVLDVADLVIDDASQFEWAYDDRRARAIGLAFDHGAVGVLDATPADDGGLSVEQTNRLKLMMDRDQRTIKQVEHFLNEVRAGEPEALEILGTVEAYGYRIGPGGNERAIEAVVTLRRIHRAGSREGGSADLLDRTMALNYRFFLDEPKTTTSHWLGGLAEFAADGGDLGMSETQEVKLAAVVPAKALKIATAEATSWSAGGGGAGFNSPVAMGVAQRLWKATGKRRAAV